MEYTKIKTNFEIHVDDLDLNIITEELKVTPTMMHFKGEPQNEYRNWKHGIWEINTEYEELLDLNMQIEKVYAKLLGKEKELLAIKDKYDAFLTLSIWVNIENGEAPKIHLNEEILTFISKIGGSIGIDVLIYS
jgi:hypothetical protein